MITTAQGLKVSVAVLGAAALLSASVAFAAGTLDLSYKTTSVAVSINGTVYDTLLTGSGNDTLVGNNSMDSTLNAGAGNDLLQGGTANDTLIGGTGVDRLIGGAGNDTFVFGAGFGADTVFDFQVGDATNHDTLDLTALGFTSVQDVLDHTDLGPNAKIHSGVNSITLLSVSKAQLANNPAVFQI